MPNQNYLKGRAKEYRVSKKLREEGWPLVIRSAGSHSIFDLIAIRPSIIEQGSGYYRASDAEIKFIQCKSGKSAKRAIKAVIDSDIKRFEGLYSVSVEVV